MDEDQHGGIVSLPTINAAIFLGVMKQGSGGRERCGETLTCKPMGRPASSEVGWSQQRWFVVVSSSAGLYTMTTIQRGMVGRSGGGD